MWANGNCAGIQKHQDGKDLCIYCVPHFFKNPGGGSHFFYNLKKACYGSEDDLQPLIKEELRKPKNWNDLQLVDQEYLDQWSQLVGYTPELRDDFRPRNPDFSPRFFLLSWLTEKNRFIKA